MQEINNTKQAAWVAVGSFFSFIVGIISPMILARYFDKGDYGTYKQVMFVYNTLLAVFTLGLPKAYAYFLPKYDSKFSKDIINKITKVFVVMGFVFAAILVLSAGPIASFLNNMELKKALIYFAPTPLFLLPTMGLDGIYASFKQTKYLAYYTIFTRVLTIICIILPVILWDGNYLHAIIGFDVAAFFTCLLAMYLKTYPVRNEKSEKSELYYKQIFAFALPLLYASLWGIMITSATQFYISRYYGSEVFADFSNGFMEIPFVGMVLGAVATVLLPAFSRMDSGTGMSDVTLQMWQSALIKSAKIIFPMVIYGFFFAEILMRCMYGDNYNQSAIYFQIKNAGSMLYIIPFAPIILAIGKTKQYANVHMCIAFIIVFAEYIVVKTLNSPVYVAVVSEICQVLKIFLLMKIIAQYAGMSRLKLLPLKSLAKIIITTVISACLTYMITECFICNKYVFLMLSLMIYIIVYYGLCWAVRISYRELAYGFGVNDKSFILKFLP